MADADSALAGDGSAGRTTGAGLPSPSAAGVADVSAVPRPSRADPAPDGEPACAADGAAAIRRDTGSTRRWVRTSDAGGAAAAGPVATGLSRIPEEGGAGFTDRTDGAWGDTTGPTTGPPDADATDVEAAGTDVADPAGAGAEAAAAAPGPADGKAAEAGTDAPEEPAPLDEEPGTGPPERAEPPAPGPAADLCPAVGLAADADRSTGVAEPSAVTDLAGDVAADGPADPAPPADGPVKGTPGPPDGRPTPLPDAPADAGDIPAADDVPAAPRGGSHRSGTAGARCTTGPGPGDGSDAAGCSSPVTGRPGNGCAVPPPSTALDRPSRTAWEAAPMKDGFCQVGSRPPNPRSATPAGLGASARWIGGSTDQVAGTGARPPPAGPSPPPGVAPGDTGSADAAAPGGISPPGTATEPPGAVPPVPSSSVRPRNRSRKPTAQPSAPARVTRDAISPVYRRRS
ncbi:hypothetical protein [Streptomyces sp. NPDC018610]|uniref:hypothetical protein n=1 Tax=Streptomyces sp. NPDC018610 TaxID=3365049 RepID=UPI003795B851